jgi:ribonuclease E
MEEKSSESPVETGETGNDSNAETTSFLKSAADKWRRSLARRRKKPARANGSPEAAPVATEAAVLPADTEAPAPAIAAESSAAPAAAATGEAAPPVPSEKRKSPGRRGRRSGSRKPRAAAGQQPGKEGEPEPAGQAAPGQAAAASQAPARQAQPRQARPKSGPAKPAQAKQAQAPAIQTEEPKQETSGPALKLLINSDEPEECRLVLLENGKVESLHVETVSREQTKGNIYKGRITAVEANLQAAFVDIGTGKNGFLPFSDIHPEYYCKEVDPSVHWKDLVIQDMVAKGQEVLVEVVKEATGGKGANMTTYLSLPGRFLVLMPGSDSAGISRKIEDEEQRHRLREMVSSFKLPDGIGYIIRTASADITKTAVANDARYLLNLWEEIKKRGQETPAPALVYKEQNIISRFLRDHFVSEIREIIVDNQEAADQVQNFLNLLPAKQRTTRVRLHQGTQPLFSQYRIEEQIEQIYQPKVQLPSGGSIVINPTEALVAIDVNSGRTSKDKNFEETIFLANMEAAEELARQLRLRDLGGLIVVDFIDMRDQKHIREVEKQVKNSMKRDKAKVDFTRISKFGLMQISRQKMASPIQMGSYKICEHCKGRGMVRSVETQALVCLRHIHTGLTRKNIQRVECRLPSTVAQYLLNKKREDLLELEKHYSVQISIESDATMAPDDKEIDFVKSS